MLIEFPPQDQPEPHDPSRDLVVILETNEPVRFAMARGLLEDARIPAFVQGQIATLVQGVDGFLRKWVALQVPRDREEEAREALDPLSHPVPLDNSEF